MYTRTDEVGECVCVYPRSDGVVDSVCAPEQMGWENVCECVCTRAYGVGSVCVCVCV